MKTHDVTSFALLLVPTVLVLTACSGASLNGGSNGNADAGSESAASGGASIPERPLQGTIAGHPFVAKSVQLQFDRSIRQWFLGFFGYEESCGVISGPTPSGTDALIVTIGNVPNHAGDTTIAVGDGHGATFQVGVGPTASNSQVSPATAGILHLDSWSETAGDTVTGGLHLIDADSDVGGTFTATVCAPR